MAKWFTSGDQHTGWKDVKTGQPVTDKQARAIVAKADADWAKRSGHAQPKSGKK